ncbi:hypothetical protein [Sodaliphilus sp.]|uniref:hypothetical protein n=1 Tax=Sodaliphilus sp. TaxID=2815818 RepID=UPI00388D6BD5
MTVILEVACRVCGCSVRQAKGSDRRAKVMNARYIFFLVAQSEGARQFESLWFLNRSKCVGYHYSKTARNFEQNDTAFQKLLAKTRKLLCQSTNTNIC